MHILEQDRWFELHEDRRLVPAWNTYTAPGKPLNAVDDMGRNTQFSGKIETKLGKQEVKTLETVYE